MPRLSPDRFDSLVAPHLATLFRTAYRLAGNVPDAEDLVQDVCASVCERGDALAAADHADRWLVRVLYNRFIDGARRQQRSPVVAAGGSGFVAAISADPGPAELAEQSQRERVYQRAWKALSDSHRLLLSLRAEGYGLAEIEEITGIGRQVLRARLSRARQSLAKHLDEPAQAAEPPSRFRSSP